MVKEEQPRRFGRRLLAGGTAVVAAVAVGQSFSSNGEARSSSGRSVDVVSAARPFAPPTQPKNCGELGFQPCADPRGSEEGSFRLICHAGTLTEGVCLDLGVFKGEQTPMVTIPQPAGYREGDKLPDW